MNEGSLCIAAASMDLDEPGKSSIFGLTAFKNTLSGAKMLPPKKPLVNAARMVSSLIWAALPDTSKSMDRVSPARMCPLGLTSFVTIAESRSEAEKSFLVVILPRGAVETRPYTCTAKYMAGRAARPTTMGRTGIEVGAICRSVSKGEAWFQGRLKKYGQKRFECFGA